LPAAALAGLADRARATEVDAAPALALPAAGLLAALAVVAVVAFGFYGFGLWRGRARVQRDARQGRERSEPAQAAGADSHTDAELAAWQAALPAALLEANVSPVVVARQRPDGWRVTHGNAAARRLWPGLAVDSALAALASSAAAAVDLLAPDSVAPGELVERDGWRLQRVGPLPGGDALVLARVAEPAAAALDAETFGPTLSHDLRAPLRVVEGFTRIVKEDYGHLLDRVGNEHLDRVLGAATRMNLMIDALLAMARLASQPLARQPVNLSQLARYVVEDLRRSTPEREVEVDIEPGLAAQGDPTLLRIVLENLLGNAWKYTARTEQPRISLRRVVVDGLPRFEVADNGAGFDMRGSERLFGLFQRLHSQRDFPGHGVGLASVRRIVRRHGGEIRAEGKPGRGARFRFTLE
jgi:signal transduction histidine kinase